MNTQGKTKAEKKKIANRYVTKYSEFYLLSLEELNELMKTKMSFTDRLALNDVIYKKQIVESHKKAIEDAKKEEESKIIQTDESSKKEQ